ncbi:MAG: DUF4405 domain-containing protein [Chlorobium sp.]
MNRSFSWRSFTSFGLFLSFLMILFSGVILYIFPGRTPGVVWELCGLSKPAWQNQHIIFGFAFSILSLCHLFFINWKAFFSYLKSKAKTGLQSPGELLVILVLSLLFGFGTFFKMQPFYGILEFGKSISNSWDNKGKQTHDRGAEVNGVSQELAYAETAPARGLWEEEFFGSYERGEGRERHHRHEHKRKNHDMTDEGVRSSTSPQLALSPGKINAKSNIRVKTSARPISDSQAPDDELHRRTSASCSSCHNTSRW